MPPDLPVGLAAIRRHRPDAQLIGIDLSTAAQAVAGDLAGPGGLVRTDLSRPLPLAGGCVDAVLCHNVLELLPDPAVLVSEAARILRPGGCAVWAHTDFASIIIHGADDHLTALVCREYAEIPQRWMAHIDPRAGRRIPGLVRRAGLSMVTFDAHTVASDRLGARSRRRVDEITGVTATHATHGRGDLTQTQVHTWRTQLADADARGDFCFAETAFIAVTRKPAN